MEEGKFPRAQPMLGGSAGHREVDRWRRIGISLGGLVIITRIDGIVTEYMYKVLRTAYSVTMGRVTVRGSCKVALDEQVWGASPPGSTTEGCSRPRCGVGSSAHGQIRRGIAWTDGGWMNDGSSI